MCEGPLFKSTIIYTVPIILTGILQLLFNAADLVVVGQYCGSVSVAAVGATGSLGGLIVNMFIGLSVGAGVAVAQAIGAKDDSRVHDTVHTAIPTALIGGVVMTIVGVCFSEQFLIWMGTPDEVLVLSSVYMRIYFSGMIPNLIYNFGSAILRASGDTRGPLVYLTSAGVLNVLLNLFFVIVFKMDVAGVALATILSQTLSAVLVMAALIRRSDSCRFEFRKMRIRRKPLLEILRIGIPAGIQASLFSISNVIIQSSVNSFGKVIMSGASAASSISGFIYTSMNAFNQTALNFAGQNVGAKKYERVKKIMLVCLLYVSIVGIVLGIIAVTFAHPLLSIYITDSEESIGYGTTWLMVVCLPYFICGCADVMTGLMRGMGLSVPPMLITVIGICVMRVVWIFTIFRIPEYHTLECLYLSYPISWLLTFAAQIVCFIIFRKIMRKKGIIY